MVDEAIEETKKKMETSNEYVFITHHSKCSVTNPSFLSDGLLFLTSLHLKSQVWR